MAYRHGISRLFTFVIWILKHRRIKVMHTSTAVLKDGKFFRGFSPWLIKPNLIQNVTENYKWGKKMRWRKISMARNHFESPSGNWLSCRLKHQSIHTCWAQVTLEVEKARRFNTLAAVWNEDDNNLKTLYIILQEKCRKLKQPVEIIQWILTLRNIFVDVLATIFPTQLQTTPKEVEWTEPFTT